MKLAVAMVTAVTALLLSSGAQAAEKAKGAASQRYLVTTTHTPEQCLAALDEMAAKDKKLLARTEWGCVAGDHTGWVLVDDDKAAIARLPEANRATAKAIEVVVFTPQQLQEIHKKVDQKKWPPFGAAPPAELRPPGRTKPASRRAQQERKALRRQAAPS